MDYSSSAGPHHRQPYEMDQRYFQKRPPATSDYSDQKKQWHDVHPYQQIYSGNQAMDRQFPVQSSYSNLSEKSQDSAYHSRHSSSIDAVDPNSIASDGVMGSGRHLHARFPSWPNFGSQSFATHTEEIVSPRTSRKIFEEAATRDSRPSKGKGYNKTNLRHMESFQNFRRQDEEFRHPVVSPGIGPVPGQPLRAKSFSIVRSQPITSSSMTHLAQYDNPSGRSVIDDQCLRGNGSPIRSQHFYNTTTQTDPSEGFRLSSPNNWWPESRLGGNLDPGYGDSENNRQLTSPKQFSKEFSAKGLSENFSEIEKSPKKVVGYDHSAHFFGSRPEAGGPRNDFDEPLNRDDAMDQNRGYPTNQSSMLRRLSKEFYGGQKFGVAHNSRRISGDDKHPRLGSIDENSQNFETAGFNASYNLGCRRKSSSEVEKRSKKSPLAAESDNFSASGSPLSPRFSGGQQVVNEPEKSGFITTDDNLGDGRNFVRNRKPQMSLRKAFGIYDEFEIIDDNLRSHSSSAARGLEGFRPDQQGTKTVSSKVFQISVPQNSSKGSAIETGLQGHPLFNHSDFEKCENFQEDNPAMVDFDVSSAHSKSSTISLPRSGLPEVTRRKSASMPRQQTAPAMLDDSCESGNNALYTGTGVLLGNHSESSLASMRFPRSVGDEWQIDEGCSSVQESCAAGGLRGPLERPKARPAPSGINNSPSRTRDVPSDDASGGSSSPPALPPRQYRKGSSGEEQIAAVRDDGPAPKGSELFSSADADFDAESTIKRDSYAQQLRLQARRLSHSSTGTSSYLQRRQPPPMAADDGDEIPEARWNSTAGLASVSGRQPAAYDDRVESSPLHDFGENHKSGRIRTTSWSYDTENSRESSNTFKSVASLNMSSNFEDADVKNVSTTNLGRSYSFLPSSRTNHPPSSGSKAAVESPDQFAFRNSSSAFGNAYDLPQAQNFGANQSSTSVAQRFADAQEPETKPDQCEIGAVQKSGGVRKKADMAVVQPNVRSSESVTEKYALSSTPNWESSKGPSPSKLGTVRGYPRPWKPPNESAYDCAAAVVFQKLPDDEKVPSESPTRDRPIAVVDTRLPEREKWSSKPFVSDRPGLAGSEQLRNDRTYVSETAGTDGTSVDSRSVPPEKAPVHRPCSIALHQSPDDSKRPTGTILPSPQHKTTADYMSDLFTKEEDGSTLQTDTLTRNSFQRASLRNRLIASKQQTKHDKAENVLPEEEPPPFADGKHEVSLNFNGSSKDGNMEISDEEKLDLINVLEKKLDGLREEKQLLNDEIVENNALGVQMTTVVEQKLSVKEFSKYRSYVDELEKVLYLMLKLSERLAKAENAVLALPREAGSKEKAALVSKRDELKEKHSDALTLKEGIDRRRHQVDGYLQKCLTDDELKDYEYFVKMKAQLVIDQQEVEDRIELGQQQLELLKCTVNCDHESRSDGYFGPKSDC